MDRQRILRKKALEMIINKPGMSFPQAEATLRAWMVVEGETDVAELAMAGYAIGSLTYDGFVSVYVNGELYAINYSVSNLPAGHRLHYWKSGQATDNPRTEGDDLLKELDWVDSRARGEVV